MQPFAVVNWPKTCKTDMGSHFGNAGEYLVGIIFGIYITILMLRVLLQLVRANFFNPVCQFIVKVTNPVLLPLRKIIPNWGKIELSAIALAWVLQAVQLVLVLAIRGGGAPLLNIIALSAVQLLDLAVMIFVVVIFVRVLLSWFSPHGDNPVLPLLYQLSAPILKPASRLIPPIAGLDFSAMIVLVLLQLSRMVIIAPLMDLARML